MGRTVSTQAQVAEHFGVGPDAVRTWRRRTPPMPGKAGQYDLDEIEEWKKSTFRQPRDVGREQEVEKHRVRQVKAEARLKVAKAKEAERKNLLEESQIVKLQDVEHLISEFLSEARRQLGRLPREFKQGYPEHLRDQIEEDLQGRIDLYLRGMHTYLIRLEEL